MVALRSLDGGIGPAQLHEAQLGGRARHVLDGAGAQERVADDAPLAQLVATHLELRLDHGQHVAGWREQRVGRRQELLEADEAGVDDHQGHRLGQRVRGEMARVGALHDHDPRVLTQAVVQLPVAYVDGVDARRPALQEAVGEAAGRRTEVSGQAPGRVIGEGLERAGQLDAAARDEGVVLAAHAQLCVVRELLARLVHAPVTRVDHAREDEGLRLGARRGQPTLL